MNTFHELQELREKRRKIVEEARRDLEAAKEAKRDATAEEIAKFDRAMADSEKLDAEIKRLERLDAQERALIADPANRVEEKANPAGKGADDHTKRVAEVRGKVFEQYLRHGKEWQRNAPPALLTEFRALQADIDTAGGFTYPDQVFVNRLLKAVDDQTFVLANATVLQIANADSLGVPTLSADPADADWTTELQTGSEDSTMAFGKRELRPNPLAKRLKVSQKLLRLSSLPVDSLVAERLGYKFAITVEKAGMTGSGVNQMLGLFTASADGIPTSRDMATGNTDTAFTADGLKNCKYNVKAAYWPRAKWIFHRLAVRELAKLKDGEGRYLWQSAITVGSPDMLEGSPVLTSEYAPSTFTAGLYLGIYGDLSQYWVAVALNMQLTRLNELYAESNQMGFIGRMELDGQPVMPEAFSRVTLAP